MRLHEWKRLGFVLFLCASANAQIFTKIADFGNEFGCCPQMSLVQGTDGRLYGTTGDGSFGGGTVFSLTMDGQLNLVYKFCSKQNCTDGSMPFAGVIVGSDGDLYGTTIEGGEYGYGTIYRVTRDGSLTTLYSFCKQTYCTDGSFPDGGLVQGHDGNIYGTTAGGGTYAAGTVFKITMAGDFTTLYSFCSQGNPCLDGASPASALTEGIDGNFYGATWSGGEFTSCCGTLFKITPSGTLTTIYDLSMLGLGHALAPLIPLDNGRFYGTLNPIKYLGGRIFSITPTGDLKLLYSFCDNVPCLHGSNPTAPLERGSDGTLYGTTVLGGQFDDGTIFQASRGKFTTLYSFCAEPSCADGVEPLGGLLQATNGMFYGTTYQGGSGSGTVYSLDMGLGPFVTFIRAAGRVGQTGGILGQGFTGTTEVSLNGTPAKFTVISDTFIRATVPPGAKTGYVTVTTPGGVLSSNVPFHVIR